MSTTAFPLLKLPYLALVKTIQSMPHIDLIDFTLCSSKCKRIVQSSASLRSTVTCLDIKLDIVTRSIYIKSNDNDNYDVEAFWSFNKSFPRERPNGIRIINGKKIKVHKRCAAMMVHEPTRWAVCMKIVIEYLLDVFKCFIGSMNIEMNQENAPIRDAQVILTVPCRKLLLYCRDTTPTNDQMHYFLNNVKASKELGLFLIPQQYFQYQEPFQFHVDHLIIHTDSWMTRVTFLSLLNYPTVNITYSYQNLEAYLELIRQWLNSTQNTSFKYMEVVKCYRAMNGMPIDLSRFNGKPWDSEKRPRYFKKSDETEQIDASDGIDIERSDGLIATILQKPPTLERSSMFQFIVWHH